MQQYHYLQITLAKLSLEELGEGLKETSNGVDNVRLIEVNEAIRSHGVEADW